MSRTRSSSQAKAIADANEPAYFPLHMKRPALLFPTALLLVTGAFAKDTPFAYPPAPKSDQVDDYHGTKVADPYRPLENADSDESRKWIEAENKLTFDYLEKISERKK